MAQPASQPRDQQLHSFLLIIKYIENPLSLGLLKAPKDWKLVRRIRTSLFVWDPGDVLQMHTEFPPLEELAFLDLTRKMLVLLLLATMRRLTEIRRVDADKIVMENNTTTLYITGGVKAGSKIRPNRNRLKLITAKFDADPRICPFCVIYFSSGFCSPIWYRFYPQRLSPKVLTF